MLDFPQTNPGLNATECHRDPTVVQSCRVGSLSSTTAFRHASKPNMYSTDTRRIAMRGVVNLRVARPRVSDLQCPSRPPVYDAVRSRRQDRACVMCPGTYETLDGARCLRTPCCDCDPAYARCLATPTGYCALRAQLHHHASCTTLIWLSRANSQHRPPARTPQPRFGNPPTSLSSITAARHDERARCKISTKHGFSASTVRGT
ncbi:hypothetical protein OH77DRAFT_1428294 [Trametes cingulata]|nr:hypothetical protein OH77DRAFT_1428294 [Trametes cingulata]